MPAVLVSAATPSISIPHERTVPDAVMLLIDQWLSPQVLPPTLMRRATPAPALGAASPAAAAAAAPAPKSAKRDPRAAGRTLRGALFAVVPKNNGFINSSGDVHRIVHSLAT